MKLETEPDTTARAGSGRPGGGSEGKRPLAIPAHPAGPRCGNLTARANEAQGQPVIRWELVDCARVEIRLGIYETAERLETAVARLAEELFPL